MKHLDLFEEYSLKDVGKKIHDYFYVDVPDGKKPRSVGKQFKDLFIKELPKEPLMYSNQFLNVLTYTAKNLNSRIADILVNLEDDEGNEFTFTNIDVVDENTISYVDAKNAKTNLYRKEMGLIDFAKKALIDHSFTERSFNIFSRKYAKAYDELV